MSFLLTEIVRILILKGFRQYTMAVPNIEINENSSSKRKQMNGQSQKRTGMLWGSNSPSLKNYKNQDKSAFSDFGKYMAEKKRKLSVQFQDEASNKDTSTSAPTDLSSSSGNGEDFTNSMVVYSAAPCKDVTQLFVGISIFVDGFTTPSHQELRNLMIKHGGMFENYFSRDVVTHIICSTLPDSKIRDHGSFSRGLPIMKPSWIVDSISCGKVLPISLYSHERIARNHPNQRTLSAFMDCTKENTNKHLSHAGILPLPQPIPYLQEQLPLEKQEPTADNCDLLEKGHKDMPCQSPLKQDLRSDLHSEKELELELKFRNGSMASEDRNPENVSDSVRSHCTLGDANFVQNYFKNSRLHFIGTWRTRYQNRFHGSKVEKDQQHEIPNPLSCSSNSGDRIVMHVDMDCFFVSVVVRNRPDLAGKPVVVCHSEKTQGTAEISSSNYAARAFGVKSGMFIRDAKAVCPELEVVPYDFEGYEQVADQFYEVLHKYCKKVQAISCDEAYLDVTGAEHPGVLASNIRKEIVNLTRCTASVGIAGNLLLARMATRKAKPDGLYKIDSEHAEAFLSGLSVEDLPGVGWSLQEKLHSKSIFNCMQLRGVSKEALQRDFGLRTGDMLWSYARGIDHRQVHNYQERKSIGAEVNWGVRFDSASDAQHFLHSLCEEVSTRLQNAFVSGRTFTLKIKKRKEGAGEPHKFMGCGSCDNLSKSVTLGCATNSANVLLQVSRQIFASFHLDVREIRGMGLQVTKLESNTTVSSDEGQHHQKALESCLQFISKGSPGKGISKADSLSDVSTENLFTKREEPAHHFKEDAHLVAPWGLDRSQAKENKGMLSLGKIRKGPFSGLKEPKEKEKQNLSSLYNLPQFSELDHSILSSLPPDIIAELDEAYNGAVAQHLSLSQNPEARSDVPSGRTRSSRPVEGPVVFAADGGDAGNFQRERDKHSAAFDDVLPTSKMEPNCMEDRDETSSAGDTQADPESAVPLSLSQVDVATLEELPTQVREDILRSLPVHRPDNKQRNKHDRRILTTPERGLVALEEMSEPSRSSSLQLDGLWSGAPPKWVFFFKQLHGARAEILRLLCKAFLDLRCPESFSSVLLHVMFSLKLNVHKDPHKDLAESIALRCCFELLKQYLTSRVSNNLEEVFMIARLVKRLAGEDHFWERICESIVPFIQAAIGEVYGGTLCIRA